MPSRLVELVRDILPCISRHSTRQCLATSKNKKKLHILSKYIYLSTLSKFRVHEKESQKYESETAIPNALVYHSIQYKIHMLQP